MSTMPGPAAQNAGPHETLYAAVPPADDAPLTFGQFRWYMQGTQHARDAVMFGLVGLVSLGIVFGPLALIEAKKAQAFGVDARAGRILGWIAIGLFALGILFVIFYFVFIFAVLYPLVQHLPRSGTSYS
ncbi:hypothetical protein SPF06_21790 [Sinomonas sp. JGH33]|uniref:DUF4190 domain-containing protein n=1 Tax=Sinomonas terricola TaxID=3110330 RepID=A0ABU5TE41_9MICC|nr:hypothetical protein [Sinomonas sp. JGH33]MEA5457356.1 hypothetical protein [Sinomonas sp. JGH33]